MSILSVRFVLRSITLCCCLGLYAAASHAEPLPSPAQPHIFLPRSSLGPGDLAVIVNDDDPLSVQIGEYYKTRRGIPEANMVHVRFAGGASVMPRAEFARVRAEVERRTPEAVQAYALTWAAPYRVDCMSITSAFALGFDEAYCSRQCGPTKQSPYYNSRSRMPHTDLKLRPTMALAGTSLHDVKALIDRGIASDHTHPAGTAYLLDTPDKARNVRAFMFPELAKSLSGLLDVKLLEQESIRDKKDVLFYFTGLMQVPGLDTLGFVPGAMADHLTSTGGQLTDSAQMSSLRWLEAGATGSYGTVVEPCNHLGKFPNPALAMHLYLRGESLIEAYWKSVAWPGEGIFVGEPLANPFGGYTTVADGRDVTVRTQALEPGVYGLLSAQSLVGPFRAEPGVVRVGPGMNELHLRNLDKPVYRLVKVPPRALRR
jgi:uncharacterized protein (TIGR03790 family)